jgi:ABC-type dipeptide/oligopeptide/nickel transport system permease component
VDWLRGYSNSTGKSFVDGRKVIDKIVERIPITLTINIFL